MIKTISAKELGTKLGIAKTTAHLHLAHFEKYRVGMMNDFRYIYNIEFLQDLKDFYFTKTQSKNKRVSKMYKPVFKKVEKLQKAFQFYQNNKRAIN